MGAHTYTTANAVPVSGLFIDTLMIMESRSLYDTAVYTKARGIAVRPT